MPADIPTFALTSTYEPRDKVLRITDRASGLVSELRVDDGITFVRFPGRGGGEQWHDASQASVFALFVAESPAAAFLRQQGVNPLRQLLTEVATPNDGTSAPTA